MYAIRSYYDSPHATTVDTFIQHGEQMFSEVEGCFDCHHSGPARGKLITLREEIRRYQESLSRVYTTRANAERIYAEKQSSFQIGQQIIQEIDRIIELSSETLSKKTEIAKSYNFV